jgi:hypothetical protein
VPGPAGPAGPAGAKGDTGATGATGAQGPKGDPGGIANVTTVTATGSGTTGATATCTTGKAVGGGFSVTSIANNVIINKSMPSGNGWTVTANGTASYTVYVVCAS